MNQSSSLPNEQGRLNSDDHMSTPSQTHANTFIEKSTLKLIETNEESKEG